MIDELLARLSAVKKNGTGWTALCPAHKDKRSSLSVTIGGDGKTLLYCHAGCEFDRIVDALGVDPKSLFNDEPKTTKKKIIAEYDYIDAKGTLLYQVVRFQPKDFRQRRPDGNNGWVWNLKGVQQTLYRLPQIMEAIAAGKTVFICEGEKDVHALEKLGFVATTNSGGAKKWRSEFNTVFTGAAVVLLPDNDAPGMKHIQAVAENIKTTAKIVRILRLPDLKAKGDVSDWIAAGGTKPALIDLVKHCEEWTPGQPIDEPPPEPVEVKVSYSDDADADDDDKPKASDPTKLPFRVLGYDETYYYYYSFISKKIEKLTGPNHQRGSLLMLARIWQWEKTFPGGGEKGTNWVWAADHLIQESHKAGYFDANRLRGSGVWRDDTNPMKEDIVQHLGNKLVIDCKPNTIESYKSHYIYTVGTGIKYENIAPARVKDSHRLLDICHLLAWEKPISASLLAGWCVIAPICGALMWRPHVWITGASGTGKTWTIDNIVKPALGPMLLFVQSNSTEAGIRQALGINAFPVLFDEAEGEDHQSQKRVQSIIELMRQASSETGAPIIKGSTSGQAMSFRIRSCFAMSSIGVNINMKADASRITVLSLIKCHRNDAVERFEDIKKAVFGYIKPENMAALRARTLTLIPTILANASIFGRVIAERFCDTRIGDQFGAMLAGAYSLSSDTPISHEKATEWIEQQDWSEQSSIEDLPDEHKCLNEILQHIIQYQVDTTRVDTSVIELLSGPSVGVDARDAMARIGLKAPDTTTGDINDRWLVISDSHKTIKRILRDTPWQNNWGRMMKRIDGSEIKKSERFFDKTYRATAIPFSVIFHKEVGSDE